MIWLALVLRVLHVVSGVFWAGTSFFIVLVLQPVVDRSGPEGERFLQRLFIEGNLSRTLAIAGGSTILLGLGLFAIVSSGFHADWILSRHGLAIALGAAAAIAAGFVGGTSGRTGQQMVALGNAIAAGGAPPSAEQLAELERLRARLHGSARITAVLLLVAVLGMSAARYAL